MLLEKVMSEWACKVGCILLLDNEYKHRGVSIKVEQVPLMLSE